MNTNQNSVPTTENTTFSIEQGPPLQAKWFAVTQEIPPI